MCKGRKCFLALDSGTTFMSVPNYAKDIMVKNKIPVGGSNQPCSGIGQWGNIDILIGKDKFTIDPYEYMFLPFTSKVQVPSKADPKKVEEKDQLICPSAVMTLNLHNNAFMVGDRFLRKYYTIFDRDNERIGLAESVSNDKLNEKMNAAKA